MTETAPTPSISLARPDPEGTYLRINAEALVDESRSLGGGVSVLLSRSDLATSSDPSGPLPSGPHPSGPWRVVALGGRHAVDRHPAAARAKVIEASGEVLLPGLVNAHTHLDLSHVGPRPRSAFGDFVDVVRRERATTPAQIAQSVNLGATLSLRGGVVAVGDIAGAVRGAACAVACEALASTGLRGVSFLEFFSIGKTREASMELLRRELARAAALPAFAAAGRVRLGLQPHAPYSVALESYSEAMDLAEHRDLTLSTHLAESIEEHEFIAAATGPQRRLLEAVGAWDDALSRDFGHGRTPVAHVADTLLRPGPCRRVLVHLNDLTDDDVKRIVASGCGVVYCPRSSAFFDAERHFGPHRVAELLGAGVRVALGTDSIINLPDEEGRPQGPRLSTLDEARVLFTRGAILPQALIKAITTTGATLLGLDADAYRFVEGGEIAGVVAVRMVAGVDPARGVLESDAPPRLLVWG